MLYLNGDWLLKRDVVECDCWFCGDEFFELGELLFLVKNGDLKWLLGVLGMGDDNLNVILVV